MLVGKWEEAQEGQFNLECLSLVLVSRGPGQLEPPDFCRFDLSFSCFSAVMYTLISRPPAVRVRRRSWRGGAGIVKPSERGRSGTPLSARTRLLAERVDISGPSERTVYFQ